MAALTDSEIKRSIKEVERQGRQKTLSDGDGRGTGRLVLIIKPMATRVTADWYAQQWRSGKRSMSKIGSYPSITLADARQRFSRDYAAPIQKRSSIRLAVDSRDATVTDLFEAYTDAMRADGKVSWEHVRKVLMPVADTLGKDRPAREVEPDEIVEAIRPVYDRGAKRMADAIRSYVRSAYSWGMKSENDYRINTTRRFRLAYNPAAGIPTEKKNPGTNWLREPQFAKLYKWLECPDVEIFAPYTYAIRLLMLTGQRVQEIASLHADQYDRKEQMLFWPTTKNGRSHSIPLPDIAVELLEKCPPNKHGWIFPSMLDPTKSVSHGSLYSFTWRQRGRGVIPFATNRDLRRTWKTLAGKAGVSKETRDRIQHHLMNNDVSTVHYDRWNYLPEKREGMRIWNDFITEVINRDYSDWEDDEPIGMTPALPQAD